MRRKTGISEATFYAWRKKYAGLMPPEMRRLRQLEENAKLTMVEPAAEAKPAKASKAKTTKAKAEKEPAAEAKAKAKPAAKTSKAKTKAAE